MIITELIQYTEIDHLVASNDSFVYTTLPSSVTPADWWEDTFGAPDETVDSRIFVRNLVETYINKYARTLSYNDCVSQEASFYWDHENQILYIHFEHSESWYTSPFSYGYVRGMTNRKVTYIDDIEYLPLVLSFPSIAQQADIETYKKMSFINGSAVHDNTEGMFDDIIDSPIYGNEYYIYYLDNDISNPTRSDLEALAAFYIQDYDFSLTDFTVRIQDIRSSLNALIPQDVFSDDDYPDIEDQYINTPIPLMYGQVYISSAIPLNGNGSGAVQFRQAHELSSLGTVQVFKDDKWTTVTPSIVSLSTGTFTLEESDARNGDQIYQCRVIDSEGTIDDPRLTIQDLIYRATGAQYNDSNYDTTEWESEITGLREIGVLFNEQIDLFEAIRQIQDGMTRRFRFEISADGKYTGRLENWSRGFSTGVTHIYKEDIRNIAEIPIKTDSSLLVSTVSCLYAKDYITNEYLVFKRPDTLDYVKKKYRQIPELEITTTLRTSGYASSRASAAYVKYKDIHGIASLELLGESWYSVRIYDTFTVELTPGFVDLDDDTISGRKFYGIWQCLVIGVNPDYDNLINRVKVLLIAEVETESI